MNEHNTTTEQQMKKGFTLPPGLSAEMEMALESVIDVTAACAAWFEFGKVPYTAADIVAMAKLAYAREREISDAEKRTSKFAA